jgi:zinc finger HIT domain-containing protein 3
MKPVDVTEAPKTQEDRRARPHTPSTEELDELFTRYPALRGQLRDIYKATAKPDEMDEQEERNSQRGGFNSRGRGSYPTNGRGHARRWTPEKGFDQGLKQLERAMGQDFGKSEGLQAFAETVLGTRKA